MVHWTETWSISHGKAHSTKRGGTRHTRTEGLSMPKSQASTTTSSSGHSDHASAKHTTLMSWYALSIRAKAHSQRISTVEPKTQPRTQISQASMLYGNPGGKGRRSSEYPLSLVRPFVLFVFIVRPPLHSPSSFYTRHDDLNPRLQNSSRLYSM